MHRISSIQADLCSYLTAKFSYGLWKGQASTALQPLRRPL